MLEIIKNIELVENKIKQKSILYFKRDRRSTVSRPVNPRITLELLIISSSQNTSLVSIFPHALTLNNVLKIIPCKIVPYMCVKINNICDKKKTFPNSNFQNQFKKLSGDSSIIPTIKTAFLCEA